MWQGAEKRRPMFVPWHRGGRRLHIGLQEFSEDIGAAASRFGSNVAGGLGFLKLASSKAANAITFQKVEAAEAAAAAESSAAEEELTEVGSTLPQ